MSSSSSHTHWNIWIPAGLMIGSVFYIWYKLGLRSKTSCLTQTSRDSTLFYPTPMYGLSNLKTRDPVSVTKNLITETRDRVIESPQLIENPTCLDNWPLSSSILKPNSKLSLKLEQHKDSKLAKTLNSQKNDLSQDLNMHQIMYAHYNVYTKYIQMNFGINSQAEYHQFITKLKTNKQHNYW